MTHAPAVIVYTPTSPSFPLKGPRSLFQADPTECGPVCTQVGFIYVTLQTSNSLERKEVELVKKFLFGLLMGLCGDPMFLARLRLQILCVFTKNRGLQRSIPFYLSHI